MTCAQSTGFSGSNLGVGKGGVEEGGRPASQRKKKIKEEAFRDPHGRKVGWSKGTNRGGCLGKGRGLRDVRSKEK